MAEVENEYEDDLEGSEDEEDGLPKRGRGKYPEIEKFELYELTHCVAYEMAMRNNEVQKIIHELDVLAIEMVQLFGSIDPEKASKIASIGKKTAKLIMTLEDEYYVVYDSEKPILSKENYENLTVVNHREPNIEIASYFENVYSLQEDEYKFNGIVNDGFAVIQGAYQDSEGFDVNIIVPNFKKPMRVFNQTQVALNLSLPIEQIKDFIEVIKNHYDQENSSIQNIKQLLGLEFDEDYKELVSMKQKEWADGMTPIL